MNELIQEPKEPTMREIYAEVTRLKDRVEELEDARELEAAMRRNGKKPLIPWEQAKRELDL